MRYKKILSVAILITLIFSFCINAYASEDVKRIAGNSRYQTSYAIADEMKMKLGVDEFSAVIVTDGMNYPDALAGNCLAAKLNAPILLVDTDNDSNVQLLIDYIHNNLSTEGTIYILGGTGAVSDELDTLLGEYTVQRLSGTNRYATNLEILRCVDIDNGPLLVCTGKEFADSLSASATGLPILLVDEALTEEQMQYLSELNTNQIYIIGGTAAVSEAVETELQNYDSVQRISGKNRFETSVQIAETFFSEVDRAIVAYAWNFPDGLSGGPLAYLEGMPLILTGANMDKKPNKSAEKSAASFAMEYALEHEIFSGIVLGGLAVLSDYTVSLVFQIPIIEDHIIVLDPGHGDVETGAFKDWGTYVIDEATINYKLSQYTKAYLEENYKNVQVYVTKSKLSDNPSLTARVKYAVDKEADILVSQHINSTSQILTTANGVYALVPTVDGTHSYHAEVAKESQKLGLLILEQLEAIGWKNNGFSLRLSMDNSKYPDGSLADYYSIVKKSREAQIPGIIIEHGFCNNPNDSKILADEEMLKKTGEADAIGIANYLDLTKIDK